jgi:hypothetical protein
MHTKKDVEAASESDSVEGTNDVGAAWAVHHQTGKSRYAHKKPFDVCTAVPCVHINKMKRSQYTLARLNVAGNVHPAKREQSTTTLTCDGTCGKKRTFAASSAFMAHEANEHNSGRKPVMAGTDWSAEDLEDFEKMAEEDERLESPLDEIRNVLGREPNLTPRPVVVPAAKGVRVHVEHGTLFVDNAKADVDSFVSGLRIAIKVTK